MTMRPEPDAFHSSDADDRTGQASPSRWVGKISVWCATRTPFSMETRNTIPMVMGHDRAAHFNALPGRIMQKFRHSEGRDPTDEELFERLEEGLALLGDHWDGNTESVQASDPLETAMLILDSMRRTNQDLIAYLTQPEHESGDADPPYGNGDKWDRYDHDLDDLEDWGSGDGELDDDDWHDPYAREQEALSPLSAPHVPSSTDLYPTVDPDAASSTNEALDEPSEPMTTDAERSPTVSDATIGQVSDQPSSRITHVGVVGERITLSGTVVANERVESVRWAPRALLVLDCGAAQIKILTSARWTHNVNPGDQLTVTGTVKTHTQHNGVPQTVLTRPKRVDHTARPETLTTPWGEVWEVLTPAPAKARPFPGQTHPLATPTQRPQAL